MVVITVNVPDSETLSILNEVSKTGVCNLVHRGDRKTYIRDPEIEQFKVVEEDYLEFMLDSSNEKIAENIDILIAAISKATTDRFLELNINTCIEDDSTKKLLNNSMSREELDALLESAYPIN